MSALGVPRELPLRTNGERLDHLSASSLALFQQCPESWRRRYLVRDREPANAKMIIGRAVDAALSARMQALIAGAAVPEAGDLAKVYARSVWEGAEATPRAFGGVEQRALIPLGARLVEAYLASEECRALRPVACQRRVEFKLSAELAWSVIGFADLEAEVEEYPTVVDWKSKVGRGATHMRDADALRSIQAAIYLSAREAEAVPARFAFHSLRYTGSERSRPELRVVAGPSDPAFIAGVRARIAVAARAIVSLAERHGIDAPWPIADPTHWRCSAGFCAHFRRCPGGVGVAALAA